MTNSSALSIKTIPELYRVAKFVECTNIIIKYLYKREHINLEFSPGNDISVSSYLNSHFQLYSNTV